MKHERYKELQDYHLLRQCHSIEHALEWLLIEQPHFVFWEQKEIFSRDYRVSNVEAYTSALEGALDSVRLSGDVKVICADLLLSGSQGELNQACLGFVRKIRKVSRRLWNNFEDFEKTAVVAIAFLEYILDSGMLEAIEVRIEARHVLAYLYEKAPGRGQYDDVRRHMRIETRMYKKFWDSCFSEDRLGRGNPTSYTYPTVRASQFVTEDSDDKLITFVESLRYFCEPKSSKAIFQTLAGVDLDKDDVWKCAKSLLETVEGSNEPRLTDLLKYIIWSLV